MTHNPSIYRITNDVETLKRVMSNPQAIKFIHNKLKELGILQKWCEFAAFICMYIVRESDNVRAFQLSRISVQAANSDLDPTRWKKIKQHLVSLKEEELQGLVKEIVAHLLENAVDCNYFLLFTLALMYGLSRPEPISV